MAEDIKYLRMTIDVAIFDGARAIARTLVSDREGVETVPTEDGKAVATQRFYPFGTGERLARQVMAKIASGDIEIDEIRDVEDHTS
jgi:hypothetical protein